MKSLRAIFSTSRPCCISFCVSACMCLSLFLSCLSLGMKASRKPERRRTRRWNEVEERRNIFLFRFAIDVLIYRTASLILEMKRNKSPIFELFDGKWSENNGEFVILAPGSLDRIRFFFSSPISDRFKVACFSCCYLFGVARSALSGLSVRAAPRWEQQQQQQQQHQQFDTNFGRNWTKLTGNVATIETLIERRIVHPSLWQRRRRIVLIREELEGGGGARRPPATHSIIHIRRKIYFDHFIHKMVMREK